MILRLRNNFSQKISISQGKEALGKIPVKGILCFLAAYLGPPKRPEVKITKLS